MSALPNRQSREETGFFEPYAAFSRTLRTWLVAYGIGAPVLFTSQQCFTRILANPTAATRIVTVFLVGVAVQIAGALLYKVAMWYLYLGELHECVQKTLRYRISNWVSEQIWLEISFDIFSIGAFAWATVAVLQEYVAMGFANPNL